MQNLGSFRPLGAILGAPSHTKLDFAIPLLKPMTISINILFLDECVTTCEIIEKKFESGKHLKNGKLVFFCFYSNYNI